MKEGAVFTFKCKKAAWPCSIVIYELLCMKCVTLFPFFSWLKSMTVSNFKTSSQNETIGVSLHQTSVSQSNQGVICVYLLICCKIVRIMIITGYAKWSLCLCSFDESITFTWNLRSFKTNMGSYCIISKYQVMQTI